jgi:hypothetical protein
MSSHGGVAPVRWSAAPQQYSLPLLPSGPGGVQETPAAQVPTFSATPPYLQSTMTQVPGLSTCHMRLRHSRGQGIGGQIKEGEQKSTSTFIGITFHVSELAERVGFEPTMAFSHHTRFPSERTRPDYATSPKTDFFWGADYIIAPQSLATVEDQSIYAPN